MKACNATYSTVLRECVTKKGKKIVNPNKATKENLKAVLDLLSGKDLYSDKKTKIQNADKIREARPEDLIIITFSTHGYADSNGNFYLIPNNIGRGSGRNIDEILARAISSQELTEWLREVVLVDSLK